MRRATRAVAAAGVAAEIVVADSMTDMVQRTQEGLAPNGRICSCLRGNDNFFVMMGPSNKVRSRSSKRGGGEDEVAFVVAQKIRWLGMMRHKPGAVTTGGGRGRGAELDGHTENSGNHWQGAE